MQFAVNAANLKIDQFRFKLRIKIIIGNLTNMEKVFNLISDYENRLIKAMLSSDTKELETLLADELIFTDHAGVIHSKTDDINAHKSGLVSINSIDCSDQKILVYDNCAIVSVIMSISGIFYGNPAAGRFRFTRTWFNTHEKNWKIVSGHSTIML